MGMPITPTRVLFCIRSLKGSPFFLYWKDFLGFFPESFPGAITTAALAIATAIIITAVITATVIGSTLIRVKAFSFGEIF